MTAKNPAGPWSDPVWLKDAPGIVNKRAVNNRALAEQKPPGGKLLLEQIKDLFVQNVFLKEMTET